MEKINYITDLLEKEGYKHNIRGLDTDEDKIDLYDNLVDIGRYGVAIDQFSEFPEEVATVFKHIDALIEKSIFMKKLTDRNKVLEMASEVFRDYNEKNTQNQTSI